MNRTWQGRPRRVDELLDAAELWKAGRHLKAGLDVCASLGPELTLRMVSQVLVGLPHGVIQPEQQRLYLVELVSNPSRWNEARSRFHAVRQESHTLSEPQRHERGIPIVEAVLKLLHNRATPSEGHRFDEHQEARFVAAIGAHAARFPDVLSLDEAWELVSRPPDPANPSDPM